MHNSLAMGAGVGVIDRGPIIFIQLMNWIRGCLLPAWDHTFKRVTPTQKKGTKWQNEPEFD